MKPLIITAALATFAFGVCPGTNAQAAADRLAIQAEIGKRHDESVKRLQDWIALPSIAAEDRN